MTEKLNLRLAHKQVRIENGTLDVVAKTATNVLTNGARESGNA